VVKTARGSRRSRPTGDPARATQARAGSAYSAFISYNRDEDQALAPTLRRALVTLAKPWHRRPTLRIFLDDTNLSANPGLWSSIEQALTGSQWLILLASPGAARSEWVDKEVARWREFGRIDRLLLVLTGGEIAWDDTAAGAAADVAAGVAADVAADAAAGAGGDFDWQATTALPPSIRGAFAEEPRYIDLRWADHRGDLSLRHPRFRDDVAELAAPLHGRSKDELDGEDIRQHRRARLLAWAAAAVLALTTMLAVAGAFVALGQRNAARDQARVALSRQLAAESAAQRATRLDRSLMLGLEALRVSDTVEARGALLGALSTSPPLQRFLYAPRELNSVAFSPDGGTIAAAGNDRTIQLWTVADAQPLGDPLVGHEDLVESVAFSPDGRLLASSSAEGTIRLWDVAARRPRGEPLRGHDEGVERVTFSPDGRLLASAGDDGRVLIWDAASGATIVRLTGHLGAVRSVAFSPDGRRLVSGGLNDGIALIWDVQRGEPVGEPVRHANPVSSLAFRGDGSAVASASNDGVVNLFDPATGALQGDPIVVESGTTTVAFSADGATLAAGTYDGRVTLWDVATHRSRGELTGGHEARVNEIVYRPGSSTALASVSDDGTLVLWDTSQKSRLTVPLEGARAWVRGVAFTAGGGELAMAKANGTVEIWDVSRRERRHRFETGQDLFPAVSSSADGRLLAASGFGRTVQLWNPAAGQPVREPFAGHAGSVTTVALSADGSRLASGDENGTVLVWDVRSGRRLGPPRGEASHEGGVTSVAFSGDGRVVASAGKDGSVQLWDAERGARVGQPIGEHRGEVTGVAFSPDQPLLASAGADRRVVLWDTENEERVGVIGTGHAGTVTSVAFSVDGTMLATGSLDHTVALWDVASRRRIGEPLRGHTDAVSSLAFDRAGGTLVSGSLDYTATVWDVSVSSWQGRACEVLASASLADWADVVGPASARRHCSEGRRG
jgi:WD40 repeat protein